MAGTKNSGNRTGLPRRKGAGRKRKSAREHWLSGDAGRRGLALVERPADAGTLKTARAEVPVIGAAGEVPAELTDAGRGYWERWAPLAKANGTLTDDTVPGFVELCRTAAECADVRADIRARGILCEAAGEEVPVPRRHPLWPDYRSLKAQLDTALARFGLTGMGRRADTRTKPDEDAERAELRRLLAIR